MNFETPKMSTPKNSDDKSFFEKIREGRVGKAAKAVALVTSLAGPASAEAFDNQNAVSQEATVSYGKETKENAQEVITGVLTHSGELISIKVKPSDRKGGRGLGDTCDDEVEVFVGGNKWVCEGAGGSTHSSTARITKRISLGAGKENYRVVVLSFPRDYRNLPSARNADLPSASYGEGKPKDKEGNPAPYYAEYNTLTVNGVKQSARLVVEHQPLRDLKGFNTKVFYDPFSWGSRNLSTLK